jgi:arylsulfatase
MATQSYDPRVGSAAKPNIVLILADDMGFSDLGCYGSEIATPHLDSMAAQGVRFSGTYNCARCCPSRASILTGLHPHQTGIGHMTGNLGFPAYQGYLNGRCVTIAEVLRSAGYHTLMTGKWHLAGNSLWTGDTPQLESANPIPLPLHRGFDEFYGTINGCGSYYDPSTLYRGHSPIRSEGDYYYTDAISQEAVAMIGRNAHSDRPFFLYVAYTAPHWPLHARPEDIAKYVGLHRRGWDATRTARHEALKGLGLLDKRWPISPRDSQVPPWDEVPHKDWEDMRMAVYAAQIDRMDQGIGKIMDELRRQRVEQNTLVVFLADNGGCAEFLAEDGKLYNRPWEIPCDGRAGAMHTRDGRPVIWGSHTDLLPGTEDTYMSYDQPWANVSNSPFRLFKHWVHEGGISTPMIACWPAAVHPGTIVHEPNHVVDLMPTFLEAAAVCYPQEYEGRAIAPLAGESLLPALRGEPWVRQQPIWWEHEGNGAVRMGEWKLVRKHPGPWELYNMEEDRTELHDLSAQDPGRVASMARFHAETSELCGVQPWRLLDHIRRGTPA